MTKAKISRPRRTWDVSGAVELILEEAAELLLEEAVEHILEEDEGVVSVERGE